MICPHDFPDLISDSLKRQGWFESVVLRLLLGMLHEASVRQGKSKRTAKLLHDMHLYLLYVMRGRRLSSHLNESLPVLLDGGANLGSNSLPAVARGYHTWAVEPVRANVERVRSY